MSKSMKRRRAVVQLVQLYSGPDARNSERFDVQERIAHFGDMVIYGRQHLTYDEYETMLWRMLETLDKVDDIELYPVERTVMAALLNLGHLTNYSRAELHVMWGRRMLVYNKHYTQGEYNHLETAKRLVSPEVFTQLLERFSMTHLYDKVA